MKSTNPLRKLAGETAIYGFSTIFARFINFVFVPIYTYTLSTQSYGVAAEFLAYIAILQVLFTMGLETGCFRYANKTGNPQTVFSNALLTTAVASGLFFLFTILYNQSIAQMLGYEEYGLVIIYVSAILMIDSVTAILFARLRFLNRPVKFTVFKSIKILGETIFNLLLFFVVPSYLLENPGSFVTVFISETPDFTYILFAILLSGIVSLVVFIPDMVKVKLKFTPALWKEMMKYSLPIMIAGLPGILNDFIDRPLFRFFTPQGQSWESNLGIFQAGVKISMLMMLFIQMFRFAAEPFFFSREGKNDSKQLYAKVMEHFTAFGMLIFLGIMFYLDILQYLIGKDFREGLSIVPVMLFSYLLLGISFNVSMWYKLSGKTNYAIIITACGLPVTLAINILLMPLFSYHAAAWGHLLSYLTMLAVSIYLGNKHYPIPYNWKRVIQYMATGLIFYAITLLLPQDGPILKYSVRTALVLAYIYIYLKTEKISIWKLKL
ncbi:MAG: oligosaccharide flippase family protein [Bacteroidales bacterium]|jgi:O-antigen/teichoic acid export membrane protein|nr:oligosaccharide flippase family protein [Bacteroidales bacterium]MDD3300763.1 oligosaccharide flippase family protein [Bacteroidales bacterium]MDD3844453.1 oligosaccharide flippase family protein [Bacteroidales bacterium]MDD4618291.1 oligosaccharide flippase family protein [Bacteroidales bacterium]